MPMRNSSRFITRRGAGILAFTLLATSLAAAGGKGGAGGNTGILQMRGDVGAVADFGSNTVSEFVRDGVYVAGPITLAPGWIRSRFGREIAIGVDPEHRHVAAIVRSIDHSEPSAVFGYRDVRGSARQRDGFVRSASPPSTVSRSGNRPTTYKRRIFVETKFY